MKMRENKIQLDTNLGKIQVVQGGASSEASRQPGFYCKACDIVVKDSVNYLDHINGRKRKLPFFFFFFLVGFLVEIICCYRMG